MLDKISGFWTFYFFLSCWLFFEWSGSSICEADKSGNHSVWRQSPTLAGILQGSSAELPGLSATIRKSLKQMASKSTLRSEAPWFFHVILTIGGSFLTRDAFSTEPEFLSWIYPTHDLTCSMAERGDCNSTLLLRTGLSHQITGNDNDFRTAPAVLETHFHIFTPGVTQGHWRHMVGNFPPREVLCGVFSLPLHCALFPSKTASPCLQREGDSFYSYLFLACIGFLPLTIPQVVDPLV